MPISPTNPGVYIDELPSAVRTIVGVPTSIAAFVGTAPRGSVTDPVHITGWADYEREFGGLDRTSDMSYAVHQFFQNGGAEAEIVRIAAVKPKNPPADGPTYPAPAALVLPAASGVAADAVTLTALSPGDWGNHLRARVDYQTRDKAPDAADQKSFNLTLRDAATGATESYLNVSTAPGSPDRLSVALAASALVTVPASADGKLPAADADVPAGRDPFPDDKGPGHGNWYVTATDGLDGTATPVVADYLGDSSPVKDGKQGIYQLLKTDIFTILCLPGPPGQAGAAGILPQAAKLCLDRRAMLVVDPPDAWHDVADVARAAAPGGTGLPLAGDPAARNAAVYFPRVLLADTQQHNHVRDFPPCGAVAGVWARTDVARGVWKAPAGTDAGLAGVVAPLVPMTDPENGILNPYGVNCLRQRPVFGNLVWGARTLVGADVLADQWKYVPVRRTALFIEESLFRGTQWVVFEPNDEPLWSSIRLNVGAFMNTLFRQGAFQGRTPRDAYQVVCDATNNPQNDIDRGIVNIQVGFAPLKPAEFVIIHIQQLAGQIQV
ncbi:phage tail sheath C-terminal domain-containing protein [Streptomyces sp. SP17BM10]|uniref:phage tail sheath family protein n=1 Tax=Streptomyces sp. SP17BM10 TaxID=3002530 RepID=UPI002E7A317B|nr:phage tail sheath C-terminal domain-containing protein [Streptomyces sp. SP17BM10]MEE1782965.1 phage tail sheath C-terminal domain-containing protein [Streptomyces sp. SP17BM10]